MKKLFKISILALSLAFLFFSCDQPQSADDGGVSSLSKEQSVVGSVHGIVTDSFTGLGLAGVTVTGPGQTGPLSATTNAAGYYFIDGLVANDSGDGLGGVTLAFYKSGYAQASVASVASITGTENVTVDAWNEVAEMTAIIEEMFDEGNIDEDLALANDITYNAASDTYTFMVEDGSTLEFTLDENNQPVFDYLSMDAGVNHQFYKTFEIATQSMHPLIGSISGNITAFFQPVEGLDADQNFDVEVAAPAVGAPVYAYTGAGIYYPNLDGTQVVTDANGDFTLTGLPLNTPLNLMVLPFDQASPSDATVLVDFDDTGATLDDGTALSAINATMNIDDTQVLKQDIWLFPDFDEVRITAHNIGDNNTPLVVGTGTDSDIELTFSQSINTSSFFAYIDMNTDNAFTEGTDVELAATWTDATNTSVTLLPVMEVTNYGEGYLDYDLDKPLKISGYGVLGGAIRGAVDGVDLDVITEDGLKLTEVRLLDANDTVYDTQNVYDATTGDLFYDNAVDTLYAVPGGSIVFEFSKDLTAAGTEVELFNAGAATTSGNEFLSANKFDPTTATNTVTVDIPSQCIIGNSYDMAIRVLSTDASGLDVYNSDTLATNIRYTYQSLLFPYEISSTLDVDTDNVDTNIDITTISVTEATPFDMGTIGFTPTALAYDDVISLEFNGVLTSQTLTMYHWVDKNGDVDIDADELVALSGTDAVVARTADTVNGTADTVVTITPAGFMAPGRYFLLDVAAASLSANYDIGDDRYFIFTVDNTNVEIPDSKLTGYSYGDVANLSVVKDNAGTAYDDLLDSMDATVDLEWTSNYERILNGMAGVYTIFRKSAFPGNEDYVVVANAAEKTWFQFSNTISATDNLNNVVDIVENDLGNLEPNALIFNNSIEFRIAAFDSKGLMSISDELSVADEVPPTINAAYGAGTGFADDLIALAAGGTDDVVFYANEPLNSASVSISSTNVDVTIDTADSDFEEGRISIDVTAQATGAVNSGDTLTVSFVDTSGNNSDGNFTDANETTPITFTVP